MVSILVLALLAQTPAVTAKEKSDLEQTAQEAGLNSVLASKMTGEQLHDVLRHHDKNDPPAVATVAVAGFFISVIVCILGVLYAVYRIYRQRSETLRLMVEKGVPIPPELLIPPARPTNDLRRGLLLIGFGLGLGVFLFAVADKPGMWTLGLVPLLLGAGYVIAARVAKEPAPPSRPIVAS